MVLSAFFAASGSLSRPKSLPASYGVICRSMNVVVGSPSSSQAKAYSRIGRVESVNG